MQTTLNLTWSFGVVIVLHSDNIALLITIYHLQSAEFLTHLGQTPPHCGSEDWCPCVPCEQCWTGLWWSCARSPVAPQSKHWLEKAGTSARTDSPCKTGQERIYENEPIQPQTSAHNANCKWQQNIENHLLSRSRVPAVFLMKQNRAVICWINTAKRIISQKGLEGQKQLSKTESTEYILRAFSKPEPFLYTEHCEVIVAPRAMLQRK